MFPAAAPACGRRAVQDERPLPHRDTHDRREERKHWRCKHRVNAKLLKRANEADARCEWGELF